MCRYCENWDKELKDFGENKIYNLQATYNIYTLDEGDPNYITNFLLPIHFCPYCGRSLTGKAPEWAIHNLLENPKDLPRVGQRVVYKYRVGQRTTYSNGTYYNRRFETWTDPDGEKIEYLAWADIERLMEE